MRVLMVSRGVLPISYRSGGAELVAFELARHLAMQEHEVTLIADIESSLLDTAPRRLTVRRMFNGRTSNRLALLMPFTFPRWLCQHLVGNIRAARCAVRTLLAHYARFDIVHTHGALATIMIARAMRRSKIDIPLVYTEHDSTPWVCIPRGTLERLVRGIVYRSINLRACQHANIVVTNFAELAKELAEHTGLSSSRFAVTPNGTDSERFLPSDGSARSRLRPGPKRYCLFVGSLIERKAPDLLLHALAEAKADLGLVVVGQGPMARDLQRLARRLSLADRVLFTGAQPQSVVYSYYKESLCLVLPSVSEGTPLVVLEALSAGKPVIASNLKGIANIVLHDENGLLVPPGEIHALSTAIDRLAGDEELYARLAANAAGSVRDRFSWHAIAHQLEVIYTKEAEAPKSTMPIIPHALPPCKEAHSTPISHWPLPHGNEEASHEEENMNV